MEKVLLIGERGGIGSAIKVLLKNNYELFSYNSDNLNLNNQNSIEKFINNFKNNFNHIVFSAGINKLTPFEKINKENIYNALNINIINFLVLLSNLIKTKINNKNSSIIMISSLYATFGRKNRMPYVLSKHAMHGACKTLAIELGKKGIRVNTISPGFIDTKLTRKNLSEKEILKVKNHIPLGRMGVAKNIADTVKFLLSRQATYISGTDIVVDGGFSAGGFMGV